MNRPQLRVRYTAKRKGCNVNTMMCNNKNQKKKQFKSRRFTHNNRMEIMTMTKISNEKKGRKKKKLEIERIKRYVTRELYDICIRVYENSFVAMNTRVAKR